MTEVEKILIEKKIYFIPKGGDLLISCLNPEHEDKHPSMRVDRLTGLYHCFSCGHKGDLFYDFNKKKNILSSKVQNLLDSINSMRNSAGVELPEDAFPVTYAFRDISAETIIKFEAFLSSKDFEGRIVFPLRDSMGIIVAMLGRLINSDANPKYVIKPKGTPLPLYPPPKLIEPINNSIILVEGIFDLLNLYDKNLKNAICCFGTTQFNKNNISDKLIPYRLLGAEKVYIMFDGDKPGRIAAKKLESLIRLSTDFLVEVIDLSEGIDPGNLSQIDVDQIKNYILEGGKV